MAEVALRVVGVVEAPVGNRSTGHRGVEHVRPAQHSQSGQVPAKRPAADGHPTQVQPIIGPGQGVEGIHLIVEHRTSQVAGHCPLPGRAPGRSAAAVGHHHGEPLVGEPLGGQKHAPGPQDPLGVRPAVRIEEHREGRTVMPGREQHRGP